MNSLHGVGLTTRFHAKALRVVYALCLAGASCTHALVLLRHGLFWNYGGLPWGSCVFWTALTFIDPLGAWLVLVRPRTGVLVTAAIIWADVGNNLWILSHYTASLGHALGHDWMVQSQIAFLLLVTATAPMIWKTEGGSSIRPTKSHAPRVRS